jgi:hypothetical protein
MLCIKESELMKKVGAKKIMGLFVAGNPKKVIFNKGDFVCEYSGNKISKEKMKKMKDTSDVMQVGLHTYVDGSGCLGRWINDPKDTGSKANVDDVVYEDVKVIFRAKRDLYGGEEILWDYGPSYWEK